MIEHSLDLRSGLDWPPEITAGLLNIAVDVTCVGGGDGMFRELSQGWEELLGYTRTELMARSFMDFVHKDDVQASLEMLESMRSGPDMKWFENRWVAKDGSTRWLSWNAVWVPEQGVFYAAGRNLAEQRSAEVEREQRYYMDLIESSHDIVQSIGPDGHFIFVNSAWHDLLGYSDEDLPNLTIKSIVHPDERPLCDILIGRLIAGGTFEHVEFRFITKDGRLIPVEGNAVGRWREDEFIATHAFFRDITERKKAEALSASYQRELEQEVAERTAALVQSEKLATLGRLSAGMAHELNNPAAAAQRGAARLREAITQTQEGFLRLDRSGINEQKLPKVEELLATSEERATRPDSHDPISRSDAETEVEDWLAEHDVSEPWSIAEALVTLGMTVDELDKLGIIFSSKQLDVVLRLVCHSYASFSLLEQISHGTKRVSEIVTALKDYSYMDRAPVQDVDIHMGLDNTITMLQGKLKGGVEVERRYGDDVPAIQTKGSELNQVWTNLIDNAVDAMGGEGGIVLRTRKRDEWVIVEVEDNGPGISPEHVENIFDPFFTTKLPGEGTGLGLNISYNIIKNQGGAIDVESEPGKTIFSVRIPIKSPEGDAA